MMRRWLRSAVLWIIDWLDGSDGLAREEIHGSDQWRKSVRRKS